MQSRTVLVHVVLVALEVEAVHVLDYRDLSGPPQHTLVRDSFLTTRNLRFVLLFKVSKFLDQNV